MSNLDLWKHATQLSVDEFMCLLFELEPGTVKFDYGDPKSWPKNADIIYRLLTDDLRSKKLHVLFDNIYGDPFYNGAYEKFHAGNDNPWWAACNNTNGVGKIYKHELVKWLTMKNIPSTFFEVSTEIEQVDSNKPKESASDHSTASDMITAQSLPAVENIPPLPSVTKRVSTEGQNNAQVKNTCRDNPEAVLYVNSRREQGAKPEEIAAELKQTNGSIGLIGCLLDPQKANVESAREHGKYLLKKAKQ